MRRLVNQFFEKQLRYSPYFYKRLRVIQNLNKYSASELKAEQEKRLIALVHKAYHKSQFYAHLYQKHRVNVDKIKSVRDLQYLPVITKHDVVPNREHIFIGSKLNRFKANTSGTSGYTVRVYRNYESIVEEGAYLWTHRMQYGHKPGMKTLVMRANLNFFEKERYDPFTKTLYLSSYQLKLQNAEWYYNRIKEFKPNAIFAYPSSVESLANFFTLLNKQLHIPAVFTSSETLYSYQREKVERVFNTKIADWYGNAERTIALQQNSEGSYDQLSLYSVNEFEKEHVITTGLINDSFPLIRYKVDDILLTDQAQQGYAPDASITEIQGRSDDVLLLPDGTRVGLICGAFDGVNHVLFSQIVQEDAYTFYINMVVNKEYGAPDEALLKKQVEDFVGNQINYTIRYVQESDIIKSKSGKFKLIVNKMSKKEQETLIS
ncbi:hypothetical protein PZB74_00605 [Porifericola rhodea]|uniref:hypothetical protein n=1 Tax=Porifericola rhodea TaxID=930972 RepID=UPI0026665A12|nr:hypothetical protein [Porifericola rhodea]WKN31859.1 hypothetical protein PZB74_00605 [Porifericola rhodea]